jgi:MYXO-CTERM domain-containing protein
MQSSRTSRFNWALFTGSLAVLVFVATSAFAGGSVKFAKREFREASGGWNLMMTIDYGSTPSIPHQPLKFQFTPTAVYERYLDDQHGETPQTRLIALTGQMPLFESVDVDFSDGRGKIYKVTKFDFTITRSHNFAAGEYSVVVKRADGGSIGGAQTIKLDGDNPVVDRRAISFVASKKGDKKDGAAAGPAAKGNASGMEKVPNDTASADDKGAGAEASGADPATPAAGSEPAPAAGASGTTGDTGGSDPANLEKVPPSSKGCGCRTAGAPAPLTTASFSLGIVGTLLALRARRRRSPRA